jgi:hypothetical protein
MARWGTDRTGRAGWLDDEQAGSVDPEGAKRKRFARQEMQEQKRFIKGFVGGVPNQEQFADAFLKGRKISKKTTRDIDGNEIITKRHGMYQKTIYKPGIIDYLLQIGGRPWVVGEDLYGCLGLGNDYYTTSTVTPGWNQLLPLSVGWYPFLEIKEGESNRTWCDNLSGDDPTITVLVEYTSEFAQNMLYVKGHYSTELDDAGNERGWVYYATVSQLPESIIYAGHSIDYWGPRIDPPPDPDYPPEVYCWLIATIPPVTNYIVNWPVVNDYTRVPLLGRCLWANIKNGTSFLINSSGRMYCCGGNRYGQLGIGEEIGFRTVYPGNYVPKFYTTAFLKVPGDNWWMVGSNTTNLTTALKRDGTLWRAGRWPSWGDGINTFTQFGTGVCGIVPESETVIKQISGGYNVYYAEILSGFISNATLRATGFTIEELCAAEQGNSNQPTVQPFSQWFS